MSSTELSWLGPILIRAAVWVLTGIFGMEAVQSESLGQQIATGLLIVIAAGVSIWTSLKARRTLLLTPPPKA